MTILQAVNIVKTNLQGLVNDFTVEVPSYYKDYALLGDWILSQACSDTVVGYDSADYMWYNIAGYNIIQGATENTIRFVVNYYNTSAQEATAKEFADTLATTLQLNSLSIPLAIKAIYDWIATNCTYDATLKTQVWYRPTGESTNQIGRNGLWDVFINKRSVCQGFSRAIYYMVNKFVTPCRIIQGNEFYKYKLYHHCWNICYINGYWYNLCVTSAVHHYSEGNQEYEWWLLKNASDFNNNLRTQFIPLTNFMRSEWVSNYPMTPSSWSF